MMPQPLMSPALMPPPTVPQGSHTTSDVPWRSVSTLDTEAGR